MPTKTERPILFSGEMVRAILDGRKTQTRRVIKPQPDWPKDRCFQPSMDRGEAVVTCLGLPHQRIACPYGQPGDRLWIRTAYQVTYDEHRTRATWRAPGLFVSTHGRPRRKKDGAFMKLGNKPGMYMPYWLSAEAYPLLEVIDVRVQRLQEIGIYDVAAEGLEIEGLLSGFEIEADGRTNGCEYDEPDDFVQRAKQVFAQLWDSLNAKRGFAWETNPWVWVITFRLIQEAPLS